jgi:virginiamycin B lyase
MRMRTALLASACLTLVLAINPVHAQNASALAGKVTSAEEGAMEGVLVTAKKAGSTVALTVVTDKDGNYSFPASRLEPGDYAIKIRAVGYDLEGSDRAHVAADKAASLDLKLKKTGNLSTQLSNAEWIQSMPGTPQQKDMLLNCVSCHTVERIVRSTHNPMEFVQVMQRMGTYANQSLPVRPQKRKAERLLEERGDARNRAQEDRAEWLGTINLNERDTWDYQLKGMPRPTGRATRVIITEYDLPRPLIEPHDVIVNSKDGMVWYTNFGEQNIGKLDPKTGKVTEVALPELKKGWPQGSLGLRPDKDGNLWFGMMYQGAIGKFDINSQKVETYSLPPEMNKDMAQVNMVRPESASVDGKIWSQNNGFAAVHRLDLKTGQIETIAPFAGAGVGENHNIYDIVPDSQNNLYFTDFAQQQLGRVDAKTKQVTLYQLPTKASAPRRGMMDAQDRMWFGEFRANKIAMFDTKADKFQEWTMPTAWASPYDVTIDKNGEVWTASMLDDRVARLDPKSGTFFEYLLPRETNIRRVFVDNSTNPVTFWVGNNHQGAIVKVEPLD